VPYYRIDINELPYPHGMGTRGERSNCPFAITKLRRTLRKPNQWSPGPAGYRGFFTDQALLLRARSCDVHQGDWSLVLPAVTDFLATIPAAADTLAISQAARKRPTVRHAGRRGPPPGIGTAELQRLATHLHDRARHREAIGQHRICAARTAGATHLPV
jgi:hypothetical protein